MVLMDFWNFAIAGSILMAPVAAGVLVFRADAKAILKISYSLFGLISLISLVSIWKFDEAIRLSFLWPVTSEPSGYFNFNLRLHWGAFLWIFLTSSTLAAYLIFGNRNEHSLAVQRKSTLFLYGVVISSALALLSENFFLSLFFVEVAFFLVFSLLLFSKGEDVEAEKSSYFKRTVFLFLSLLSLLGLAILGKAHTMTILLMGSLLYVSATIFSRHTLSNWGSFFLNLQLFGLLFFLNGRIANEDFSSDLLFYFSLIFAALSILFSIFSALVSKKLDSVSWLFLSVVTFLLFARLSTPKPEESTWLAFEVVGLASILAISLHLRFSESFQTTALKTLQVVLVLVLLSFLTGAIPAIDQSVIKAKADISVRMILFALITFLLSMAVGKTHSRVGKKDPFLEHIKGPVLSAIAPTVVVVFLFIGLTFHFSHLFGEGSFHQGFVYVATSPHVLVELGCIFLGFFLGFFLGRQPKLADWEPANKILMEKFFPGFDPKIVNVFEGMNDRLENLQIRTNQFVNFGSEKIIHLFASCDRWMFGEKVYGQVVNQSFRASSLLKSLHSGSSRSYLFWGVVVVLISLALFYLEGK